MPQSFACLHYHLIFSTKDRDPFLVGDLPERLYPYIGGIVRSENGTLLAAGGMPDHVHLIVSLSRESSVSDMLRQIKGTRRSGSTTRFRICVGSPGNRGTPHSQ
jgi:REP element-mobilizing transposase RayT